jgi:CheY-like chemotaxis protein
MIQDAHNRSTTEGCPMPRKKRSPEFAAAPMEPRVPGVNPVAEPEAPGAAAGVPRATQARRLLIVDDNRDSAESLRLMYEQAGHRVLTVAEGAAAVEAAARLDAEAVLLDIGLPDLDGYEVARRLRADPRTRDAVIIAITGYGREEDLKRSRGAGIDHHMVKPVDPDEVLRKIARGRPGAPRNSTAAGESDRSVPEDEPHG